MAFFDDFSKHVDRAKKGAIKTMELAKIQHQIGVKQDDFDKLFEEIGKLYYSNRQRGVQPDETMDALCDKVDALAQEISLLKDKMDELRQVNRCPSCSSEQSSDNTYCSVCGAKLPEKKVVREEPETEGEEENRDVYINWPDGSAKEEAETSEEEAAEEATEEEVTAEEKNEEV